MNKHVNKNKRQPVPILFVRQVEDSHEIPVSVATDLFCTTRTTNPERKRYMRARAVAFTSTRQAKPSEEIVAGRLQQAKWDQITKWLPRLQRRAADTQRVIRRLQRLEAAQLRLAGDSTPEDKPLEHAKLWVTRRQITIENVKGTAIQNGIEAIEEEIARRKRFWASLRKVAPSVAAAVENK